MTNESYLKVTQGGPPTLSDFVATWALQSTKSNQNSGPANLTGNGGKLMSQKLFVLCFAWGKWETMSISTWIQNVHMPCSNKYTLKHLIGQERLGNIRQRMPMLLHLEHTVNLQFKALISPFVVLNHLQDAQKVFNDHPHFLGWTS